MSPQTNAREGLGETVPGLLVPSSLWHLTLLLGSFVHSSHGLGFIFSSPRLGRAEYLCRQAKLV